MGKIHLSQSEIWDEWVKTYKMRNKAAHGGITPSMDEAAHGIVTIRTMVDTIEKTVES